LRPKRRNTEEELRTLERRAREGDVEAGFRLARRHERVGGVAPLSAFSVEDLDQSLRKIIRDQVKTRAITQYLGDIRDLVSWGGRSVRKGLYDVVDDAYGGIMIQNHRQTKGDETLRDEAIPSGRDNYLVTVGIHFVKFREVFAKWKEFQAKYPDRDITFVNTAATFDPWDEKDASNIAWGVAFADDRVLTNEQTLVAWRRRHKYRRTRPGFIYDEAEGGPVPREQGDAPAHLTAFEMRAEQQQTAMADRWRRHDEARAAGLWPVMEQDSPSGETRREMFERWLREGRVIGVYENQDMGSPNLGNLSFAPVDAASPPRSVGDWRSSLRAVETSLDRFVFI
jgi:hypothetical protein